MDKHLPHLLKNITFILLKATIEYHAYMHVYMYD